MQAADMAVVNTAHPGKVATQQDALVLIHNDAVNRAVGTAYQLESAIHTARHFVIDNRDLNLS